MTISNHTLKASDEATQKGIELAKKQGEAYQKTLEYMITQVAHGKVKQVGELKIGYAVEDAEGLYYPIHDRLKWEQPEKQNAHVEISVCDARDGRFIPGLTVIVTLIDSRDKAIGTHQQPFLWHPWLYHYGLDWAVQSSGKYKLHVLVAAPSFPRHDKKNGQFFNEPVEVTFTNVEIEVGQKK